jgi:hypothetical protein
MPRFGVVGLVRVRSGLGVVGRLGWLVPVLGVMLLLMLLGRMVEVVLTQKE